MSTRYDVVVIGAGFAGLTAARELALRDCSVLVLEARDRIGGRTWTTRRFGRLIEVGGTWVHWLQPHVWTEIHRYGLAVERDQPHETTIWRAGDAVRTEPSAAFWSRLAELTAPVLAETRTWFERPAEPFLRDGASSALAMLDRKSVGDRIAELGLGPVEQELVRGLWALKFNGSPDDGGYTQALQECAAASGSWPLLVEACSAYRLRDGMVALATAMADDGGAEIELEQPVLAVEQDALGVRIATQRGEVVRAERCVVTVPLAVLPSIRFSPPLSELKRAAAAAGQASQGVKVWIRVRGDIGPLCLFGGPELPLTCVQSQSSFEGDTIMVGFGPRASRLHPDDREGVAGALRQWCSDLEVLEVFGHDWTADPFSAETWPMRRPGQLTRYLRELQAPEGRVQLASSGIANGWSGFVDGAIESGLTAARRILARCPIGG